jgi:hypothetical protein
MLGWAFVFTLFAKRFRRARGLERFRANYVGDQIRLLDEPALREWSSFGGCIACGRCDLGEGERIRTSGGDYPGLMVLVLASLRNPRELAAAERAWQHVPLDVLAEKEALCPTQVPFRRIKHFVETQASEP